MGLIGFDVNVSTITDLSSILSSSTIFGLLSEAGDVHRLAPLCPCSETAVDFAMCQEHNGLGNRRMMRLLNAVRLNSQLAERAADHSQSRSRYVDGLST